MHRAHREDRVHRDVAMMKVKVHRDVAMIDAYTV